MKLIIAIIAALILAGCGTVTTPISNPYRFPGSVTNPPVPYSDGEK